MRLVRPLIPVLVASLAGCASGGSVRQLGSYSALSPSFTLPTDELPLQHASITLGAPAYVSLVYIVPGSGALVVYPTDSATYNHLDAGTHVVSANFPNPPNRDSILAEMRRGSTRRPSRAQRDSIPTSMRALPTTPEFSPYGHLLLFATAEPLRYGELKSRVEGLTIPLGDTEAVNTVIKLIRAGLPESAAWSGYAKDIELP